MFLPIMGATGTNGHEPIRKNRIVALRTRLVQIDPPGDIDLGL